MKGRLAVFGLLLLSGCANLSREALAGLAALGGAAGTYVAVTYVQDGMRCGDLAGFSLRGISTGFNIPGVTSSLSAHFRVTEEALAQTTHSADITLANAISVSCYLVDRYPQNDSIHTLALRMVEAASAPRLVLEEAARQISSDITVPRTEEALQAIFGRFAKRIQTYADSVHAEARARPEEALTESIAASESQRGAVEFHLRLLIDESPRSVATHHAVQTLLADVADLRREAQLERRTRERAEARLDSLYGTTASRISGLAELPFLAVIDSTSVAFRTGVYVPDDTAVARLVTWTARFRDPGYFFSLTGEADTRGSVSRNQLLSEARATYVRSVLIEQGGIPPVRITTSGIGVGTQSKGLPLDDPTRRRVRVIVHGVARDPQ